jgi:hypothetical protein
MSKILPAGIMETFESVRKYSLKVNNKKWLNLSEWVILVMKIEKEFCFSKAKNNLFDNRI